MAEPSGPAVKLPDPVEISRMMGKIAEQSQRLVSEFLARQQNGGNGGVGMADPLNIGQAFFDMTARMMANPAQLVEAQIDAVAGLHGAVADRRQADAGRAGRSR